MLETRAIVVQVEGERAVVESIQGGGCGYCGGGKSCGSSKLSQLFCTQPRRFHVRNSINAHIGEEVQVSVADGVLLRSALILYGLPMLLLFGGALLGAHWAANIASRDVGAAIGAALGLVLGFLLAGLVAMRQTASSAAEPVMVRRRE